MLEKSDLLVLQIWSFNILNVSFIRRSFNRGSTVYNKKGIQERYTRKVYQLQSCN